MIPSRVWMKALNRGVCVFKGCWFKTWFVWRLTWKNFKGCSLIKNIPDFAFLTEPFDLSRHLMLEGEELTDCFSLHQRDSDPSPMQQPSLIVDRCSLHQPKISSKRSGGLVCCRHRVHHGRGGGGRFSCCASDLAHPFQNPKNRAHAQSSVCCSHHNFWHSHQGRNQMELSINRPARSH